MQIWYNGYMKHAYTLLGIMTLIVFAGAYFVFNQTATAPHEPVDIMDESQTTAEALATPETTPLPEAQSSTPMKLSLTSPAFAENGKIPSQYTCDGDNVSPEIHIGNVPEGTKSLVLVMDDPDIPEFVKKDRGIEKFDHWAVYNIPPETTVIKEGEVIGSGALNSRGSTGYIGACPPDREHRYIFRLYALSGTLNFIKAPTLDELETAAQGMSLDTATLTGLYERVQKP
jgi:hypothetical protein